MAYKDVITKVIADSTKELICEKALEKITVLEICEKSGIKHRTFYRYFKDKHEVVEWIFSHESLTRGLAKPNWSFWDYFPLIAQTLYNSRIFYRRAFQYHGQNSFRWYSISQLRPILEKDYGDCFPDKQSLTFFIEQICNMAFDSFIIWLSLEPCPEPAQFVQYFQNCFAAVSNMNIKLIEQRNNN